jgi:hypothetical protein
MPCMERGEEIQWVHARVTSTCTKLKQLYENSRSLKPKNKPPKLDQDFFSIQSLILKTCMCLLALPTLVLFLHYANFTFLCIIFLYLIYHIKLFTNIFYGTAI